MTNTITHANDAVFTTAMAVDIPCGRSGQVEVRRFDVSPRDAAIFALRSPRRAVEPGTYTGLYRNDTLWMSDTQAERRDHLGFLRAAYRRGAERVLINGLGLGMVRAPLYLIDSVRHVDVVEIDRDVIALVEPHYQAMAATRGKTLTVHHGDAYEIKWPVGTRWDVAWHDIWPTLTTDNLSQMTRLHRRYGARVRWQESWCRSWLRHLHARERRQPRW